MKLDLFQKIGVEFLVRNYHAALADEPGLGKTPQSLYAAALVGADATSPWLITCPASVRTNWLEHIEHVFSPAALAWFDVISYNEAVKWAARGLGRTKYRGWIGDEIHFCKNLESQRTRAIFARGGLARRADYKWCLSGTLAPNGRPVELYPMLKTLCPAFKDMTFAGYAQRYCGAYWDGYQLNVKGATRIDELSKILNGFMLRRTKREVFPDRKEPLIERIPLDLTPEELAEVNRAEEEILNREALLSPSKEKASQLGDTSKMLRLLGLAMASHVVEFVEDLLRTTDKVVVFAQHTDVIHVLANALSSYGVVVYEGGMTDTAKSAAVATFQGGAGRVFIGQRQAAGTGINGLQRVCSTAVIAEPPWVPGETEQLIDRLDRMGQEDELVTAYVLYARKTLSAAVLRVHDVKEQVGDRLMGKKEDPWL